MSGKLERFAQLETFNHVFQPTLADVQQGKFEMKGKWNSDFFKNDKPIVLELGCGRGEYTVALARQFPDKNYIGVDIKGARIWSGAKIALTEGLRNVAYVRTHIEMITNIFAKDEVSEIWLTFPDPQLKKQMKRLTGSRFLNSYYRIMKQGGIIHLKTDSPTMHEFTKEIVGLNGFPLNYCTADLYAESQINEILQTKTYYENMFLKEGHAITYLNFSLTGTSPYKEPEKRKRNIDAR